MQGMFNYTPALATVASMQENYDKEAESAVNQQKGLQDILMAQQSYAFNEQNNPLKLANSRLTNQGLEAGLPGIAADSRLKTTNANKAAATYDSDVATANSNNQLTQMKNSLDRYQKLSDTFTTIAHSTKDLSPIERVSRARMEMEAAGMKVDSPQAQQFLQEVAQNPYALLARADEAKRRAAELSPEYLRQVMMEEQHNKRNAADNVRSENVATTQANARVAAVQARQNATKLSVIEQVQTGKLKASEVPAAFRAAALRETDPDMKNWLLQEAALAHQANLDRGNARAQPGIDGDGKIVKDKPENVYDDKRGPALGTKENPIKLD